MRKSALIKVAIQSILKNKLRTFLTMLGIIIGVAAVIVMVAIGSGAQSTIQKQVSNLGTNMIFIMPGASAAGRGEPGRRDFQPPDVADAEKLKRESTLLAAVSPVAFTGTQAISAQGNWRTRVNGVSTDFQTIRDWPVSSGMFFSDSDLRAMRKVAVIGNTVAQNLYPGRDPVGQQIQVRDVPFKIIGVLSTKGQQRGGQDQDDVILVPYTTAQARLNGNVRIGRFSPARLRPRTSPAAQDEMRAILRESHKIARRRGRRLHDPQSGRARGGRAGDDEGNVRCCSRRSPRFRCSSAASAS